MVLMLAMIGAAVGYGSLKRSVNLHEETLGCHEKRLMDLVSEKTCIDQHEELKKIHARHATSIRGLENFARWWLAVNGKSPSEISDILSGNGR